MKFLGRLLLWQKLAVLGVLALVSTAVPFYLFWQDQQATYNATDRERVGLKAALLVLPVLQYNQQHRGLSANYLGGKEEIAKDRADKQAQLDRAIIDADNVYGEYLKKDQRVVAHWEQIKKNWRDFSTAVSNKTITVPQSYQRHTDQSAELLSFLDELLGYSGMQLDPNEETYALIHSTLQALPSLTEDMGQGRAKGSGMMAVSQTTHQPTTIADRLQLAAIMSNLQRDRTASKKRLDFVYETSPQLRANIEAQSNVALDQAQRTYDLATKEAINPELPTYSSVDYYREFTAAIDEVFKAINVGAKELDLQFNKQLSSSRATQLRAVGALTILLLVAASLGILISRSVTGPVNHLVQTMIRIAQGDKHARVRTDAKDELGLLSNQFDQMVDERESVNERLEKENEKLNNSIIHVLQAVAELSKRDLSVKVPVNEDITGPVADAINALSDETVKVLRGVTAISGQVSRASNEVRSKSDAVMVVAEKERVQVDETAKRMAVAAHEMNKIAELARHSQITADAAIKTTQDALRSVTATVTGISSTRDTIRETEKRIKRLGERSQEISGVVSLINSIAERTHILALNASMHAASAGEAGRGFAVVADEVQRLAENAREATTQIATLVSSIQAETQDTVSTMNSAITQVVEGSKLAEEAGRQMQATQDTTSELVKSVQQISTNSLRQAKLTNELQEYAKLIRESTAQTSQQLSEQGEQTRNLVEYADKLVESVNVFKLPSRAA
ncbi:MAG TPA: methyl-accepting chemotaxis protein [Steroidobacteraceae bacterium]|jgi:methyl-accepting chemotaxis protein|nr:methyl-accepting chemotaxis protein [Steroidobacteraceae bacterium]